MQYPTSLILKVYFLFSLFLIIIGYFQVGTTLHYITPRGRGLSTPASHNQPGCRRKANLTWNGHWSADHPSCIVSLTKQPCFYIFLNDTHYVQLHAK